MDTRDYPENFPELCMPHELHICRSWQKQEQLSPTFFITISLVISKIPRTMSHFRQIFNGNFKRSTSEQVLHYEKIM